MDKLGLRLRMIERRGQLTPEQVASASIGVTEQLIGLLDWSNVHTLHSYKSSTAWKEVQPEPFLTFLERSYPKIDTVVGPVLKDSPMPKKQFDVILVPLLAFDTHRSRLGFGGGWYDKFLGTQPDAITIGLAYDFQLVSELPTEPHDIRLSKIVTESKVYG